MVHLTFGGTMTGRRPKETQSRAAWWLAAALTVGCGGTAYYAPPQPPPGERPSTVQPQRAEIPPQTFTPAPHRPRVHPPAEAAVLTALPAVSTRGRCVDAGSIPEGGPGARKSPSKRRRSGFVPFAPTSRAEPSGASEAPKTASPADDAVEAGATSRSEEEAPGFAPASGASAPEPEATARRADGKERRRSKRNARRDTAATTAPASELDVADEPPPLPIETLEPQWPPAHEGWGAATYLSNDDSMSLSSPQRVRFAIDNDLPLPLEHIRKHELLNAASFETAPVERGHDFSVDAQLAPSQRIDGVYSLALSVAGRPVGRQGRRNAVVTWVVDRSGSMKADDRMSFVKRGMMRMLRELKPGDIVNIVTFDHRVCTPLTNYVVGRDDPSIVTRAITDIRPAGNTNLHAGLTQGYRLADAAYQPKYSNRVIVITDALANRGVTDPRTLGMVSDWFDSRRIRLSGIGVGRTFDDHLLDGLTERGRGAYVFLGSDTHVEHVFGAGFTSLIETTANDVHYRLHLPMTMRMRQFYGEEASGDKAEVQAVHFFADTSQLLLADIEAWQGELRPRDGVMLEIEYQHPDTGETMNEQYAFSVAAMAERDTNVRKAEVLMHFAESLEDMVRRFGGDEIAPPFSGGRVHDPAPVRTCQQTQRELSELTRGMDRSDQEVRDVLALWGRFCRRYGASNDRPPRKQ